MDTQVVQTDHLRHALVRTVKAATVFLIFVAIACFALGCGEPATDVFFTRDEIVLYVGDSRDLAPYMTFEPKIDEHNKTVAISADGDCIVTDGTTVTAVKAGTAVVRAATKGAGRAAEMTVTVLSREQKGVYIATYGNTYQALNDGERPASIEFAARFTDEDEPIDHVPSWYVNDAASPSCVGNRFKFEPRGIGEYAVTLRAGEYSAEQTVKIYRKTQTAAEYVGKLDQPDGDFSPIRFYARENVNTMNPETDFEWSVNGVAEGALAVFEFTPTSAGVYKIALTVNGHKQTLFGADCITVTASGARAPLGTVVFDDEDGVCVKWSDGEHIARVSIISPDGVRRDVERSDATHAYRFERGRFNAEGLIDVFSDAPRKYSVTLVADGKREFEFMQYPELARSFADEKVLLCNSFISNEEDCERYMRELYAVGVESARCYIAGDANKIISAMRACASEYGASAYISLDGSIATVELDGVINAPSEYDEGIAARMYTTLPHIEYDGSSRRPRDYVLALDRVKKIAEVESSEQLLLVISRGVRPVPVKDSTAAVIYASARHKLVSIIGADYTAEQKVHAIYDWLQWVTVGAEAPSASGCGRFLEGVFGSAEIPAPSGGLRRAAVTSEGAAKAFALLCRMEGIECIILSSETQTGERRFWNKVELDGVWYNADVYGGKIRSDETGLSRVAEQTSHRGLFTDDEYMRDQGLTVESGSTGAYDMQRSVYLKKRRAFGECFDYYAEQAEKSDGNMYRAAIYAAFSACNIGSVSVPVTGGTETYINNTLGVEFCVSDDLTDEDITAVASAIRAAADKYVEEVYGGKFADNAVRVYRAGRIVGIAATPPRRDDGEE